MTSIVFSSATRLLALLKTFARVLQRQVDTLGGGGGVEGHNSTSSYSFFNQASTIMAEVITVIQAQTS